VASDVVHRDTGWESNTLILGVDLTLTLVVDLAALLINSGVAKGAEIGDLGAWLGLLNDELENA